MKILFSNRYITIAYLEERNCLIQTWKSFCSSEEFREGQKKSVELFIKTKSHHFICDATDAGLLQKEDTDWVAAVITPQFVAAGMPYLNMVVAKSAFTQMTLQNLMSVENATKNTVLRFFDSLEGALESLSD